MLGIRKKQCGTHQYSFGLDTCDVDLQSNVTFDFGYLGETTSWIFFGKVHLLPSGTILKTILELRSPR